METWNGYAHSTEELTDLGRLASLKPRRCGPLREDDGQREGQGDTRGWIAAKTMMDDPVVRPEWITNRNRSQSHIKPNGPHFPMKWENYWLTGGEELQVQPSL